MMTAAPKIQRIEQGEIEKSESYEAHREKVRIRLTADEQRTINYCLVGWDSEVGLGSNFGAMAQASAASSDPGIYCATHQDPPDDDSPLHEHEAFAKAVKGCAGCADMRLARKERRQAARCPAHRQKPRSNSPKRAAYDAEVAECSMCSSKQRIACKGPSSADSVDVDAAHAIERWCDKPASQREKILRCWRTLKILAAQRSPSLVVLVASYGDMPPGLPSPGLFEKSMDMEYRRVIRYAPGSGGSGAALDALLHVDKHRRAGETLEANRTRVVAAECQRRAVLLNLGAACEEMLKAAVYAYRAAWLEAGQ